LESHSAIFAVVYLIKVKGKVKIPDYIQLRDDSFTLLAYFRADRPETSLEKLGLSHKLDELRLLIGQLPYGKIYKWEI
jgi:hypothetical protein